MCGIGRGSWPGLSTGTPLPSQPKNDSNLTAQIRNAAVSIPANIAEGAGRSTRPDYSRFLSVAGGSLNELESHLTIAGDLGFGDETENQRLLGEISQIRAMLTALAAKVTPPRSRPTKT